MKHFKFILKIFAISISFVIGAGIVKQGISYIDGFEFDFLIVGVIGFGLLICLISILFYVHIICDKYIKEFNR